MGDTFTLATALRLLGSFGVIIAALLVLRWWTQRGGSAAAKSAIKVHARVPLARGATAVILDVDQRRFLVGVTEHGVSLLSEMQCSETATSLPVVQLAISDDTKALSTEAVLDLTDANSLGSSVIGWQDFTEAPRTGDSERPRNGLVRRMQDMTLRAPARVPVHGHNS